jgi:hypothetical protein
VQFEGYTIRDRSLEVYRIQKVDEVSEQWLAKPEEQDEISEHKAAFFDELK